MLETLKQFSFRAPQRDRGCYCQGHKIQGVCFLDNYVSAHLFPTEKEDGVNRKITHPVSGTL
jgi:hypothetical protein